MLQIISKDAIDKSGEKAFDLDNAKGYGAAVGLATAGFISAHAAAVLFKKTDSALVNGGIAAVGLAGAMYVKNPLLKIALLGVSVYGITRVAAIGVQEAVTPGTTVSGLTGFIPDSLKAKIRRFIPTLSGVDNLLGLGNTNDDLDGFNLDDQVGNTEDIEYEDVTHEKTVGNLQMI